MRDEAQTMENNGNNQERASDEDDIPHPSQYAVRGEVSSSPLSIPAALSSVVPPSRSADLQGASGRAGPSISSITVPIRLDALSYLLHSAVAGAYRMSPPMPYPPQPQVYPSCSPYAQMGCPPYAMCMAPHYCSAQAPHQPGYVPCCGHQPMVVPGFNQGAGGAAASSAPAQAGMASASSVAQESNGSGQWGGKAWGKESGHASGANTSSPFSSESQRPHSSPRRGFGKFGEEQDDQGWQGRRQGGFRRGFGRGREDSFGRSWQGSAKSSDRGWRGSDRSGSADYGKRGRWSGGNGGGGRDAQPKWPSARDRLSPGPQAAASLQPSTSAEDWEADYPMRDATSESGASPATPGPTKMAESPAREKASRDVDSPDLEAIEPERPTGEEDAVPPSPEEKAEGVLLLPAGGDKEGAPAVVSAENE